MESLLFALSLVSIFELISLGLILYCLAYLCFKTTLHGRNLMFASQVFVVAFSLTSYTKLADFIPEDSTTGLYLALLLPLSGLLFAIGFLRLTYHLVFTHTKGSPSS